MSIRASETSNCLEVFANKLGRQHLFADTGLMQGEPHASPTSLGAVATRLDSIDWEALAIQSRCDVEVMAGKLLISRKTIERHFRQKWGQSPARWAKRRLLEKAKNLICQGYSVKAIVIDLHMCNESWFCREFRKMFGTAPGTFRFQSIHVATRSF